MVYEGAIREKPESDAEARAFIAGYGVAPAVTVGAIAVTDLRTGRRVVKADSSSIAFDPVPEEVIDFLVEEGECAFCAGGLWWNTRRWRRSRGKSREHGFAHGALEDRRGGC